MKMSREISGRLAALFLAGAAGVAHAAGDIVAMQGPALAFAPSHYPDGDMSTRLYDELDYQRAVQAYIWGQPLVGLGAMAVALSFKPVPRQGQLSVQPA